MMTLLRMAFPFLFKVKEKDLIVENTKTEQSIKPELPKHKYNVILNVVIGRNDNSRLKWAKAEATVDGQKIEPKQILATDTSVNLFLGDVLMAMYGIDFYKHSSVRDRIGSKVNLYMSGEELIPYNSDKICISVNIIKR